MLQIYQVPTHPNLFGWRSRKKGGKVHIALRTKPKSLCGLQVPQWVNQPEDWEWVCANCEAVLRSMDMLAGRRQRFAG